jgi:hypothetical protein
VRLWHRRIWRALGIALAWKWADDFGYASSSAFDVMADHK